MSTPTPDPTLPTRLRVEEYVALRATIRERGTRRVTLVVAALVAWATLALAIHTWPTTPLSTLVPLLVLASGFEAAFALHVGVERVGRYLQVFYESTPECPQWEHTAMRFGAAATPASGRVDPLFSGLFILATTLNLVPVVLLTIGQTEGTVELVAFGTLHVALIARILLAQAYARRQRQLDIDALTR